MKKRTNPNTSILLTAIAAALLAGANEWAAYGSVILEHTGANNPTTEGFSEYGSGGVTGGSAAGGAWRSTDDSGSGIQIYGFGNLAFSEPINDFMTAAEITQMQQDGWVYEITLDIVSYDGNLDDRGVYTTFTVDNGNGNRRYDVHFDNDNDDFQVDWNPIFQGNTADVTVSGAGFHTVTFTNGGGGNDDVNVLINGVGVGSFSPDADASTLTFGSVSSHRLATADYSLVRFSVVPEPSTLALIGVSGLILRALQRRRMTVEGDLISEDIV